MEQRTGGITLQRTLTLLLIGCVFLLAITKIEDTDSFTHLSFGKWIWEHKAIPTEDPFISTSKPFPYNNWLFGFVYYLAYHFFNVYGVILLKACTVSLAFFVLLRDAVRPYRNYAVAVIVLAVVVILVRHRFVERPDTFLMVFLPFSVFSLNAYVYDNKKYLYALPVVHMIWANSHTSLPLMVVPFIAFLAGGSIQHLLGKKGIAFEKSPSLSQMKMITVIFGLSFVCSLISPYFIGQYTHSAQALASEWWKQEINELKTPTWETNKWPHFMAASLLISFLLNIRRCSISHLFLSIPFTVLSFTAVRFISLAAVMTAPVFIRNISSIIEARDWQRFTRGRVAAGVAACMIILCTALIMTRSINPLGERGKTFGFGFEHLHVPEGALQYMDRWGIEGKVFNLFQWGGYITWRDFPKRVPFIDGRGFLDSELLERSQRARGAEQIMDELQATYGFDAVLAGYEVIHESQADVYGDMDSAFNSQKWALVYWDDSSLLYLKRDGKYDAVIKEDEYRFIRPANGITGMLSKLHNEQFRTDLIAELKRNMQETNSVNSHAYLGGIYQETGLNREAITEFGKALENPYTPKADIYNNLANAYLGLGDVDHAIAYYGKSLSITDDPTVIYNLGLSYYRKQDYRNALKYLKNALEQNKNLLSVYPLLLELYQRMGMKDDADRTMALFEKAQTEAGGEDHFKSGLRAYFSKNYEEAIAEFRKSIQINPANPTAYSNLGYVYFDIGMIERAYEYQKRAIEIDPNHANAHYGLALIAKKEGDLPAALKHWERYLQIEPEGYYARRAKEEIATIDSKNY